MASVSASMMKPREHGAYCFFCDSRCLIRRPDGAFVRCWYCMKATGFIHLGESEPWSKERHERIKREAGIMAMED